MSNPQILFCASLLAISFAEASWTGSCHGQSADAPVVGDQLIEQQNQRISAALETDSEWKFLDTPLSHVATSLQDRFDINVQIDSRALEDYGIAEDTPVTVFVSGISLRSLLNLMLRELELAWSIQEGVLIVSTAEELEANLITRIYPVTDLAGPVDPDDDFDRLIRAISSVIHPDSWDAVGGPGSIQTLHGALIVSSTLDVHEAIAKLLAGLREVRQSAGDEAASREWILEAGNVERIRAELDRSTEVEFVETPLSDVAQFIGKLHQIPVVFDLPALDDFGIPPETPVTFELRELPLRRALTMMLDPLDLTFMVRDEVLLITTYEAAEARAELRIYAVGELTSKSQPQDRILFMKDLADRENLDSLIETIQSTVAPDSWDFVGGHGAVIPLSSPAVLLISQTEDVHQQIGTLLSQLRGVEAIDSKEPEESDGDPPADEDTFVIQTYLCIHPADGSLVTTEVYDLIGAVLGDQAVWTQDQGWVRTVGSMLVVRQTPQVHRQIQHLLDGLGIKWSSPQPARPGGGGMF